MMKASATVTSRTALTMDLVDKVTSVFKAGKAAARALKNNAPWTHKLAKEVIRPAQVKADSAKNWIERESARQVVKAQFNRVARPELSPKQKARLVATNSQERLSKRGGSSIGMSADKTPAANAPKLRGQEAIRNASSRASSHRGPKRN